MLEAGIYSFHRYWLGWTTIHGYDPDKAMQEWNGLAGTKYPMMEWAGSNYPEME